MSRWLTWVWVLAVLLVEGCKKEDDSVDSYFERTEQTIQNLEDELVKPENGWILSYSPVLSSGEYKIWLSFQKNGEVYINSDLGAQNGEFGEDTLFYRVDIGSGVELVFETYGIFHYLFEQEGSTFGAEFEFGYVGKQGDKLVFESLSDLGFQDLTRIVLTPANTQSQLISEYQIDLDLRNFDPYKPRRLFIDLVELPKVAIVSQSQNVTMLAGLDLNKRILVLDYAVNGTVLDSLDYGLGFDFNDQAVKYKFQDERLVFLEPIEFSMAGKAFNIESFGFGSVSNTGKSACPFDSEGVPVYTSNNDQLGSADWVSTYYSADGLGFRNRDDTVEIGLYSINTQFLFDDSLNTLIDERIFTDNYPDASDFLITYEGDLDSLPSFSVGIRLDGGTKIYLQKYDSVKIHGNRLEINLQDDYYFYPEPDSVELEQFKLNNIMSNLFEDKTIYIYQLSGFNADIYWLTNPCNSYNIFLVKRIGL